MSESKTKPGTRGVGKRCCGGYCCKEGKKKKAHHHLTSLSSFGRLGGVAAQRRMSCSHDRQHTAQTKTSKQTKQKERKKERRKKATRREKRVNVCMGMLCVLSLFNSLHSAMSVAPPCAPELSSCWKCQRPFAFVAPLCAALAWKGCDVM